MNNREKTLAIAIVALLGVFGSMSIHGRIENNHTQKTAILSNVRSDLDSALDELKSADRAEEKLRMWRACSLPYDEDIARSLYQHWVVTQLSQAGLSNIDVKTQLVPVSTRSTYGTLTVNITAEGPLGSLTSFLFAFYEADLLHKISSLLVSPNPTDEMLDLTMEIEALILPDAENSGVLPKGTTNRLANDNAKTYVDSIVGRNLFAVYKRSLEPRLESSAVVREQPTPKPKSSFDDATQAYVTGIVELDGRLEAWINVRTTGEFLRLSKGATFEIGLMSGYIADISARAVLLETDDGLIEVGFGQSFRQGESVKADTEM